MSIEAVLARVEKKGNDMDGNPARRVTVDMVVLEYAGTHAEHTGGTDWFGREDRTIEPVDESVLDPAWCRYLRTVLSLVGLLEAPHCLPDVRGLCLVAHQNSRKGQKLVERWIGEGPLNQVPSEYRCDRTFVTTASETTYIQRANAKFRSGGDTRRKDMFLELPECV